jgi:hypothetical protein
MAILTGTQQNYYEGENYGSYQFVSLKDIINQFMIAYVGEEKVISKARRTDVVFHAKRALAELSFDTFKSFKSQEIVLPPSLIILKFLGVTILVLSTIYIQLQKPLILLK